MEANLKATVMLSESRQVVIGCMIDAYGCGGNIVGVAITGRNGHCHAMVLWAFGVLFSKLNIPILQYCLKYFKVFLC